MKEREAIVDENQRYLHPFANLFFDIPLRFITRIF